MFGISKKRITTDLFQLALILTLLHNGVFYPEEFQIDLTSTNATRLENQGLGNDVIISDGIFGSTYYSHTSAYHQPMNTSIRIPHLSAKQIDESPVVNITNAANPWVQDDNAYYRERILEELRRLSIQRYSELPREVSKAPLAFQNVTAYLLNNTNDGHTSDFIATVPELPLSTSTFESSIIPSSFYSTSIIQDEGTDGVETLTESYVNEDTNTFLLQEIEEISLNYKDGFSFQDLFVDDARSEDLILLQELQNELNAENIHDNENQPNEFEMELDFSNFDLELPKADSMNLVVPSSSRFQENVESLVGSELIFNDAVEGAAALPLAWPNTNNPLPEAEELEENMEAPLPNEYSAHLSQYSQQYDRRFDSDDFSDEEMMFGISPRAIHEDDEDDEVVGSLETGLVSTEETKIDRRRGISSSGGSISSHDDLPNSGDGDQVDTLGVNSLLDEIWETDSGIFDSVLDSPGLLEADEKIPRKQSECSLTDEPIDNDSHDLKVHGDSSFEESRDGVEDSLLSDEMLQTAPIHSGVRPTPHSAQPRAFQVHARMNGQMRGSSVDQRWQELASLLSLQPPHGDPNGPIPPALPHHFGAHHHLNHHHHHPFHHPPSLHHSHHSIHHHSPFGTTGPTNTPYTTESSRSALIQNATIPPPELNVTGPYSNVDMGPPPPNLGSAVASSMHLTNNSDPMSDPTAHYNKILENSHDVLYYNSTGHSNADLNNQTTEGILSSFMNDEALQLMDMMAMNEGMYTMRMLDSNLTSQNSSGPLVGESNLAVGNSSYPLSGGGTGGTTTEDRLEASSDSAVSSMGSERVPPMIDPILSDNDWSESEHHSSPYGVEYSHGKLRGYDYYGKGDSSHRVVAPVPQKKHQMFGKRLLHEQGNIAPHPFSLSSHPIPPYSAGGLHHLSNTSSLESLDMKYPCNLEFARQHDSRIGGNLELTASNHTYSLPPTHPDNPMMSARTQRHPTKEKQPKMMKGFNSEEHVSRDEKRARSLGLPLTTDEIINLPMDEFNERLSKHDLSEPQLSLIRDIRRRGKNKVAAQNCRKRKIDQISQLENEVNVIRQRKQSLLREHESLVSRRNSLADKYSQLQRHVFQGLRNSDGNPYSLHDWTLVQGPDGNVSLIPRQTGNLNSTYTTSDSIDGSGSSRRGNSIPSKSKDDMKKDGTT